MMKLTSGLWRMWKGGMGGRCSCWCASRRYKVSPMALLVGVEAGSGQ